MSVALKPSLGIFGYLLIALGIYAILFVLSIIAHYLFGIEFWTVTYEYPEVYRIADSIIRFWGVTFRVPRFATRIVSVSITVDVVTYLFTTAILLIFFVLEKLLIVIVLIVYWIVNSFIIGRDPVSGSVEVPFALFQLLGLIPVIGEFFVNVPALSQSTLTGFAGVITTLRSFTETLVTGGFGVVSQELIELLNKTVFGRG